MQLRYPVICWIETTGRWKGMMLFISRPKPAEMKAIIRIYPIAWVVA